MDNQRELIYKLLDVSNLLETGTNLEESLREIASTAALILKARRCSIMLLSEAYSHGQEQYYLQVFTHYGNLPPSAYQEITRINNGIAGYVAATAQPLLIKDITQSSFLSAARYPHQENHSFISAPVIITKQVVGVINVSNPSHKSYFDEDDLQLLKLCTQYTGKSLHIAQLQAILKSRFVAMAVARELEEQKAEESIAIHPNPTLLAKLVAKSFFRELTRVGFGPNQVIAIATEVLNLLQTTLDKHKQRLARDD
jgi:GAF domain-containing protein